MNSRRFTVAAGVLTAVPMMALSGGFASASAPTFARHSMGASPGAARVVVTGLNNPRGLAFGRHGRLFIAEAGRGGHTPVGSSPEGGSQYAGRTGRLSVATPAIMRMAGHARTVVGGLISIADSHGMAAEGPVAVGTHRFATFLQFGLSGREVPSSARGPIARLARRQLGHTEQVRGSRLMDLVPTGNSDYAWTGRHKSLQPDQFPDSNPNGLLVTKARVQVANAGSNLLTAVSRSTGSIRRRTYFQVASGMPADAVPTCVAQAPDGSMYVGELLGGNYAPGGARVWQIKNGHAHVKWTGFTTIQGCGFDSRGNFYATEFSTGGLGASNPGDVVRVTPSGHRSVLNTGGITLVTPSGFAYHHGAVYVSNFSIFAGQGQVVRIPVNG